MTVSDHGGSVVVVGSVENDIFDGRVGSRRETGGLFFEKMF